MLSIKVKYYIYKRVASPSILKLRELTRIETINFFFMKQYKRDGEDSLLHLFYL